MVLVETWSNPGTTLGTVVVTSFVFESQAYLKLVTTVTRSHNRECCGFLLGRHASGLVTVQRANSVRNSASQSMRFAIADYERRRVEHLAQRLSMSIVAIFHSHPYGWPELSRLDRLALEYSDLPWLIAVLTEGHDEPGLLLAAYEAGTAKTIPVRWEPVADAL